MLSNEIHKSCPIMDFKCFILLWAWNTRKKWKLSISMKAGLSDLPREMPRMKSICPVRLWILSALYYFKPQIHEKSENYHFQWKWVYRIKHVKFYRIKSISPVRLRILSALYYFKPQMHEKSENYQFQWKWVYRI